VPVEASGKFAKPTERVSDSLATLATDDPFPFDSLVSDTSRFMADTANDTNPAVMTRELWGAEGDGFTRTAGEGNLYSRDGFDPAFARMGVMGLNIYGRSNGGSRLLAPVSGEENFTIDLRRLRLTITGTEVFDVACGPGAGTEAYRATRWRPSSALSNATDIIDNSLRLTRLQAEGSTPARDGVARSALLSVAVVGAWPRRPRRQSRQCESGRHRLGVAATGGRWCASCHARFF
jgi:hypothetical protein